jgi:hypothetical protein
MDEFRRELRALVDKYLVPSSTFDDYVEITAVLEEETDRLDMEAEKLVDSRAQG